MVQTKNYSPTPTFLQASEISGPVVVDRHVLASLDAREVFSINWFGGKTGTVTSGECVLLLLQIGNCLQDCVHATISRLCQRFQLFYAVLVISFSTRKTLSLLHWWYATSFHPALSVTWTNYYYGHAEKGVPLLQDRLCCHVIKGTLSFNYRAFSASLLWRGFCSRLRCAPQHGHAWAPGKQICSPQLQN